MPPHRKPQNNLIFHLCQLMHRCLASPMPTAHVRCSTGANLVQLPLTPSSPIATHAPPPNRMRQHPHRYTFFCLKCSLTSLFELVLPRLDETPRSPLREMAVEKLWLDLSRGASSSSSVALECCAGSVLNVRRERTRSRLRFPVACNRDCRFSALAKTKSTSMLQKV